MKNYIYQDKDTKKNQVQNVISSSSKIEGLSFVRARKNNLIIKKLQKYGRAFSI